MTNQSPQACSVVSFTGKDEIVAPNIVGNVGSDPAEDDPVLSARERAMRAVPRPRRRRKVI